MKVTLVDYKGDKTLKVACEGPIFFANSPAGRWIIEAELNGEKVSRTADVNGRFYVTFDMASRPGRTPSMPAAGDPLRGRVSGLKLPRSFGRPGGP